MRIELIKYLNENPDYQKTKVTQLFNRYEYNLLYTPPYTPTTQPIEKVWGYVKNYVARLYSNGRTIGQLRNQTLTGFYGEIDENHPGVTAEFCNDVIEKSHRWCNNFLKEDGVLNGSIDNVTFNSEMDYNSYMVDLVEDEQKEPLMYEDSAENDPQDASRIAGKEYD